MTADDVDALLQRLPSPSPSPELRRRVLGDIDRRLRRPRRVRRVAWGLGLAAALAGFAAALGVILPVRPSALPSGEGRGQAQPDLKFARIEWELQTKGEVVRTTATNDQLFVEMRDGVMNALDRFTGKLEWTLQIAGGSLPDWPPVVAQAVPEDIRQLEADLRRVGQDIDRTLQEKGVGPESQGLQKRRNTIRERLRVAEHGDNVYVVARGSVICIGRKSGALKWTNQPAFTPSGPPFAIRDYLFVPEAARARVHALDVNKGGAEVLEYAPPAGERPNPTLGGPVYADPSLFFIAPDGTVYCYRVTDGTLIWKFETGAGQIRGPIVHVLTVGRVTTRLLLFSVGQTLYAMEADAGLRLWSYDCGAPLHDAPMVGGDTVYVRTETGTLLALEALPAVLPKARQGRLRWQQGGCDRFLLRTPTRAYVLGVNREILAVDESTGGVSERYATGPFGEFAGRSSDGRLYGVRRGAIVCFIERP